MWANSSGYLAFATLKMFFIRAGEKACFTDVIPLHFLVPPNKLEEANSFFLNMLSISFKTRPLQEFELDTAKLIFFLVELLHTMHILRQSSCQFGPKLTVHLSFHLHCLGR